MAHAEAEVPAASVRADGPVSWMKRHASPARQLPVAKSGHVCRYPHWLPSRQLRHRGTTQTNKNEHDEFKKCKRSGKTVEHKKRRRRRKKTAKGQPSVIGLCSCSLSLISYGLIPARRSTQQANPPRQGPDTSAQLCRREMVAAGARRRARAPPCTSGRAQWPWRGPRTARRPPFVFVPRCDETRRRRRRRKRSRKKKNEEEEQEWLRRAPGACMHAYLCGWLLLK